MAEELAQATEQVGGLIRQLDEQRAAGTLDRRDVVAVAAWFHARIVRIHPFLDGNGRTSRLCLDYFSFRYGLPLFSPSREKEPAYLAALDWYVARNDPEPVVRYLTEKLAP